MKKFYARNGYLEFEFFHEIFRICLLLDTEQITSCRKSFHALQLKLESIENAK